MTRVNGDWVHSGDLGHVDGDGNLFEGNVFVVDRVPGTPAGKLLRRALKAQPSYV